MIDSLLFAVRDSIWNAGLGWSKTDCDLQADGHPPPKNAGWYCAIFGSDSRGMMRNARDEYTSYTITLTKTVDGVPRDKIGDKLLAQKLAVQGGKKDSFNARAQALSVFLDSNWFVIGLANQYLVEMYPNVEIVNGFCEPAMWDDTEEARLVGGEWLSADPESADTALVAEIRFRDARRLQAIATYS